LLGPGDASQTTRELSQNSKEGDPNGVSSVQVIE
jgi:hypothetical protein